MTEHVRLEQVADGVALVTLDNPPLNLLSNAVKEALLVRAEELAGAWPDLRAVVLTGAGGRAFSAGADMKEFPVRVQSGGAREASNFGHRLALAWLRLPQVTVAAISGVCMGGGAEVALFCDFRVAGAGARLAFPEVQRGWFPGNGGTQLLPRLIGRQAARRLLLTGEAVTAESALAMGLVDEVVADGEVQAAALAWARTLAGRPAQALVRLKRLLDSPDLVDGLAREAELFGDVFATADAREGIAAFLEKRQPAFRHR